MFIGILLISLVFLAFVVGHWAGQYTGPEGRLAIIIGIYLALCAFVSWLIDVDRKLNPRTPYKEDRDVSMPAE